MELDLCRYCMHVRTLCHPEVTKRDVPDIAVQDAMLEKMWCKYAWEWLRQQIGEHRSHLLVLHFKGMSMASRFHPLLQRLQGRGRIGNSSSDFQFTEPTGGPIDFEDSLCNLSGLEGSGRTLVCSVSRKRSAPDMPMQSCEAFDVGAFTLGFHAVARIEPDLLVFADVAQFPDSLTGGSKSQVARSLHEMNQTQIKYFKAMQVGKYTDSV